jgi:nitrogen fixation NifU-like protein
MISVWEILQEPANVEMRRVLSDIVVDHALNLRNAGSMDGADGYAGITGPCGDTMCIWLKVKDDTIGGATFMTDGCGTTIAAGGVVTEIAMGRSITQALRIGQQDVLNALGRLPEESQHCALLAANTLKEAIKDYLAIKKEPWKKTYRRH